MPAPTRKGTRLAETVSATAGVCLYLLTASLDLALGGTARFLLVYPLAAAVRLALPAAPSPVAAAIVAALFPTLASLSALIVTGRGRWWQRRAGLRRPSVEELETLALAYSIFAPVRPLPRVAVWDDPRPLAAVRGSTVIVSRGLLDGSSLSAVLAHECGHLWSLDGRLTEALDRLSVWDDPLGPSDDEASESFDGVREERPGLLFSSLRLLVRLAGGGEGRRALQPLWSVYWRHREFAADAAATAVGQGLNLARHLRDEVMPFEVSRQVRIFNLADHPPTALRIERLEQAARPGGSK